MTSIVPVGLVESKVKSTEIVESTLPNSIKEGQVTDSIRKPELVSEPEEGPQNTKYFAEMFTKICLEIFYKNEEK
jgi:hypothetical protein